MARTKQSINYEGVGAELNVWNIPVQASQYTSGRIKINNGAESIEVGWTVIAQDFANIYIDTHTYAYLVYLTNVSIIFTHFVFQVNPGLYGDNRTHLYIYTNVKILF